MDSESTILPLDDLAIDASLGFEPRSEDSKSFVLPLHHEAMKMEVRATDPTFPDKVGRLCSYYFHLSVPPPRLELGSNASKALMLSFTP